MESQKAPYPPHVIKTIAGIMASKDVCAPNYLKGPELVGLFQTLGFPDSYTFVEGRGIQTLDFGEGLSRLAYTTKRLEALNKSLQMPDAIRKFIENVQAPQDAINSIQDILQRFNLPLSIQIKEGMCNEQENLPIDDKKNDAYNNDVGIDVDLAKTQEDICTESDRLKK